MHRIPNTLENAIQISTRYGASSSPMAQRAAAKTAQRKDTPSAPCLVLVSASPPHLDKSHVILDYGCGLGDDVRYLRLVRKFDAVGWDPIHYPEFPKGRDHIAAYDRVLSTFVLDSLPREFYAFHMEGILTTLKPNGWAYVSVATPQAYDFLWDKMRLGVVTRNTEYTIFCLKKKGPDDE